MHRHTRAAAWLFLFNTVATGLLMWEARPRTVATMDPQSIDDAEYRALIDLLTRAQVAPNRVRICEVRPCTRGPAVFIEDGAIRRLELPRSSQPGPLRGGE